MADTLNPMADLDSERAVLAAVLIDGATLPAVEAMLRIEHFHAQPHRLIFAAILDLASAGSPLDLVTLSGALHERDELEGVGGREYLAGLLDGFPRVQSAEAWAKRVREKARRRQAIVLAERLIAQARNPDEETDAILDRHQGALSKLLEAGERRITSLADVLPAAMRDLDEFLASSDGVTGIPTGLLDFDRLTGGMKPGALYVIAARPGRGKSALCAQTAVHAASTGRKVLVFSMEMEPYQLGQRMLFAEAMSDRWELMNEWRDQGQGAATWERIGRAYERLSGLPVYFDPRESPNLAQVRASCRQQSAIGLDLVIVDYLQRCTVDAKLDRWLAVGDLAKGLKSLARNLKVPVLAACQLNADAEEKRPTLAMLGQAQSIISAEADLVGMLHPQDLVNWKTQSYPLVDLYVDKHRAGACMAIQLSFEKRSCKFVSVSRART